MRRSRAGLGSGGGAAFTRLVGIKIAFGPLDARSIHPSELESERGARWGALYVHFLPVGVVLLGWWSEGLS